MKNTIGKKAKIEYKGMLLNPVKCKKLKKDFASKYGMSLDQALGKPRENLLAENYKNMCKIPHFNLFDRVFFYICFYVKNAMERLIQRKIQKKILKIRGGM